eukprot:220056_1
MARPTGTRQYFQAKILQTAQSDEFKLNFKLISSIYQNDENTFDTLIDSFPDINKGVGNGKAQWTLLMLAVHNYRTSMVQKLLFRGADPNCIDKRNKLSVLIHACSNGYHEIVKLLLSTKKITNINYNDNPEGISALYAATKRSRIHCIQLLLNYELHEQVCDVNVHTVTNEQTPVFIACDKGDLEMVKLFINYKHLQCDLNAMDHKGYTPLMKAVAKRHYDVVQFLLSKENPLPAPNINLCNRYKQKCCTMIAVQINTFKISKLLLNNSDDESGQTNVVELYRKDHKGRTLLDQCLIYHTDKRIVKYIKELLYTAIHSTLESAFSSKESDTVPYVPASVVQFIFVCKY